MGASVQELEQTEPLVSDAEEVHRLVKDRGIEFLFAQFVDLHGKPNAKLVPAHTPIHHACVPSVSDHNRIRRQHSAELAADSLGSDGNLIRAAQRAVLASQVATSARALLTQADRFAKRVPPLFEPASRASVWDHRESRPRRDSCDRGFPDRRQLGRQVYPPAALAEVGRHAACLSTYKDHEIRAAHHLIGAPPTVGSDHAHRALRRWSRGASRIGRATARLLLDEGAVVTIADIEDEKLAAATATLSRNGSLTAVNCDVPSMTQARSAVDRAVAAHGHLDVVVCAAGIPSRSGIEALEEEDCDRVLAVNLKSIFTVVNAVRHLRNTEARSPRSDRVCVRHPSTLPRVQRRKGGGCLAQRLWRSI